MKTRKKYINTKWDVIEYDVWGNAKDGYEVNNAFRCGEIELRIPVTVYNQGTPNEFEGAYPTDVQIRKALLCNPRIRIECDGDDVNIYVNHATTSYPLGELRCVSHASLSPVKQ